MTTEEKLDYLESLSLQARLQSARDALYELTSLATEINETKRALEAAKEVVQSYEAGLILSDAYLAGKNAETRAAWLRVQRLEDMSLASAISDVACREQELARLEVLRDAQSRRYQLALAEIRLAAAQLQFLAE